MKRCDLLGPYHFFLYFREMLHTLILRPILSPKICVFFPVLFQYLEQCLLSAKTSTKNTFFCGVFGTILVLFRGTISSFFFITAPIAHIAAMYSSCCHSLVLILCRTHSVGCRHPRRIPLSSPRCHCSHHLLVYMQIRYSPKTSLLLLSSHAFHDRDRSPTGYEPTKTLWVKPPRHCYWGNLFPQFSLPCGPAHTASSASSSIFQQLIQVI